MKGMELLRALCMAFGPSGCEDNVAALLKEQVLPFADTVTPTGWVLCWCCTEVPARSEKGQESPAD